MDSESAAQASAQQKHHKHMMFGKKQRYIEVFQCSGEDMNLVLNGGYQYHHQSPPALSAKPLNASGMLPSSRPQSSTVQPLQVSIPCPPPLSIPISIPQAVLPTASNTNAVVASATAANANQPSQSSLIAQQQQTAHFIAQHNLMARQQAAAAAAQLQAVHQQSADQQMAFLQNFNFLPSPAAASANLSSAAANPANLQASPYATFPLGPQVPHFFYLPRPMLPMSMIPSGLGQVPYAPSGYMQHLSGVPAGAQLSAGVNQLPQTTAALANTSVKRSYENAFRNEQMTVSAAKRAFHPNQAHTTTNIYGTYPYPQL